MNMRGLLCAVVAVGMLACIGCDKDSSASMSSQASRMNDQVIAKWGKPINQLPVVTLSVVSPHNADIRGEFAQAFRAHHALEHGKAAEIHWVDLGSSNEILTALRDVYAKKDSAGVSVVWGGGELMFERMAQEGMLTPMRISDLVMAQVPPELNGLKMYDEAGYWCGAAISGFGFVYDKHLLKRMQVEEPRSWDDLAGQQFRNLVAVADPARSGSAVAAFEMIVQSEPDWPVGWAKLLAILGNARQFYSSAEVAADGPLDDEPVAICIDFYGANRMANYPRRIKYVSPQGQTAFNADPIAILKNPPDAELAQRFVDFVLSRQGQALLALRPGEADGPIEHAIGRQPIRRDIYTDYLDGMLPWVVNPFEQNNQMTLDIEMRDIRFDVLRKLTTAAAVKNHDGLKLAIDRLRCSGGDEAVLRAFAELPPDVKSPEQIRQVAEQLKDPEQAEKIVAAWTEFFRTKYESIAQ